MNVQIKSIEDRSVNKVSSSTEPKVFNVTLLVGAEIREITVSVEPSTIGIFTVELDLNFFEIFPTGSRVAKLLRDLVWNAYLHKAITLPVDLGETEVKLIDNSGAGQ
jgi:hypothetical protein